MGGWSSSDYKYSAGDIGNSAYSRGCGNGWLWIHKRPNMFLQGTIANDGSYSLRFYKPNGSQFEFALRLEINGTVLWSYNTSQLNGNEVLSDVKNGNVGSDPRATVRLFCGAYSCDVGANTPSGLVVVDTVFDRDTSKYVYVHHNNEWRKAVPYVYHNGEWKEAEAYVYHNGVWRLCNT